MSDITKETQELMNVLEKAFYAQEEIGVANQVQDNFLYKKEKEILVLEGDFNIRLIAEHIIKEFGTD